MRKGRILAVAAIGLMLACVSGAQAVNMQTVPVGNPGNAGELSGYDWQYGAGARICGAVGYNYCIGKFEVTAGQYTEFLNAVAKTDTYGLYDTWMDTGEYLQNNQGCNIKRTGTSGNYSYSVAQDWANRPVNLVSWGDAARFANWMHNGQPTGAQAPTTTEDGSYYLNGATSEPDLLLVTRRPNATWVIPSEDEWYKAAYHKNDGITGNYFDHPASSDTQPRALLEDPDPGNTATLYTDRLNFPYCRTEVGDHENSESPYGTFDQGGNVWEMTEAILYFQYNQTSYRQARGGSYADYGPGGGSHYTAALEREWPSGVEDTCVGFRVALVPEPATLSLLALGGLAVIRRKQGQ